MSQHAISDILTFYILLQPYVSLFYTVTMRSSTRYRVSSVSRTVSLKSFIAATGMEQRKTMENYPENMQNEQLELSFMHNK